MHDGYGPCPKCDKSWDRKNLTGVYNFRASKTTGWMCPWCCEFFVREDVEFNGRVIGETEAPVPPAREPPGDHG